MGVQFGSIGALNVSLTRRQCASMGLPTGPLERCNRFTNPLGLHPGFGHLLVGQSDLSRISLTQSYPLSFVNVAGSSVSLQGIRVVGEPYCVTPGSSAQDAAFVLELADQRMDLIGLSNACYNWREYPDAPLETWSLNSGQQWGLLEVVIDLLSRTGFPNLYSTLFQPVDQTLTYAGSTATTTLNAIKPWQVDARGCRAADLVEDLLFQFGLYVRFDPTQARPYSIRQTGADFNSNVDDPNYGVRIFDSYENVLQDRSRTDRIPGYVRVTLPAWGPLNGSATSDQYAYCDFQNNGGNPNFLVWSQSMFPARLTEVGGIVSTSEIQTAGARVATAVLERITQGSVSRAYSGFLPQSTDRVWDATVWQEVGDGRYPTSTVMVRVGFQGSIPLRSVDAVQATPTLRSTVASGSPVTSNGFMVNGAVPSTFSAATVIDRYGGLAAPSFARWERDSGTYGAMLRESVLDFASGMSQGVNFTRSKLTQNDSLAEGIGIEGFAGRKLFYPKAKSLQSSVVKVAGALSSGFYPGVAEHYNAAANTFSDGDNVWVLAANGESLTTGNKYPALRSDQHTISGDTRPVYIVGVKTSDTPDGGNCQGLGWLLEGDISCLKLTVTATHGHCLCIDDTQTFKLYYDFANDRWLGGPFLTCCGCSSIDFIIDDNSTYHQIFGKMRLVDRNQADCDAASGTFTQSEYYLWNFRRCKDSPDGNPTAQADGANTRSIRPTKDNCDDEVGGCDNSFTVQIECITDCDNKCCCPGCASLFNCSGFRSAAAYYVDLSGFTGDGQAANVLWVLSPSVADQCGPYVSTCPDPFVEITLSWIGSGMAGWRMTIDVGTGSAVYETSNVFQDCYTGFTMTKTSSSIGGPATVDVHSLGNDLSNEDECCQAFPATLHATIANGTGGCACLDGLTLTLTLVTPIIESGCAGILYSSGDYVDNDCVGDSGNTTQIQFGCNLGVGTLLQVQVNSLAGEGGFLGPVDDSESTCDPIFFVAHCHSNTNGLCGSGDASDGDFDVIITL